jgi:tyrosine aminotransferase
MAIIQAAIPAIFKNIPDSFFARTMEVFENNAKTCYSILSKLPGLHPVIPAGSMFIMVRISKLFV